MYISLCRCIVYRNHVGIHFIDRHSLLGYNQSDLMYEKGKRYGHKLFYKVCEELMDLHSRKNYQYATVDNPLGNFERCGEMTKVLFKADITPSLAVLLAYMSKQWDGVLQMVGLGKTEVADQLEDKFFDLACYSIIAIVKLREMKE